MPMPDGVAPITTRADPALVKALARAFRYQRMLDQGRYATIIEIAQAERIERGYLGTLLRLTLLAPDIVEAVTAENLGSIRGLPELAKSFPEVWASRRSQCLRTDAAALVRSARSRRSGTDRTTAWEEGSSLDPRPGAAYVPPSCLEFFLSRWP